MARTTHVYPTNERYKPSTRKNGFKRNIPESASFEPLSDALAEKINTNHALLMSADMNKTSHLVFLKGNELWAQNPNKYDVLGLDAPNVPEYSKIPDKIYPNQIFKIKRGSRMNYYLGDKNGHAKRTMPPEYKKKQAQTKKERQENLKRIESLKRDNPSELHGIAKAQHINAKRSDQAKTTDSAKSSKHTIKKANEANIEKWSENPGKFDIKSVDTKKKRKSASEKPTPSEKRQARNKARSEEFYKKAVAQFKQKEREITENQIRELTKSNEKMREEANLYTYQLHQPEYKNKKMLLSMVQARSQQIQLNNQLIAEYEKSL